MREIACILYGSNNYELDSPNSDKDYKVIMCPQWDDLYTKRDVSLSDMDSSYDHEHYSPIDCRQFDRLLHKCNPNILELVYSIEFNSTNDAMCEYISYAKYLLSAGYIALHWRNFYAACQGIAFNTIKRYGETYKAVSRAWYFLELVKSIPLHGFHMGVFTWRGNWYNKEARAIRYNTTDNLSSLVDYIKNEFTNNKEQLAARADQWIKNHPTDVRDLYKISTQLTDKMQNLVLNELTEELNLEVK